MKQYDVVVLGAGMGGLAAAALWGQKGFEVCLVESHYSSGGCAGYFKRKQGYYDVGATTLSGLEHGRPVHKIIEKLNLNLKTYHCNPGIKIKSGDKVFNVYANTDDLSAEIKRVFGIECKSTIEKWYRIEKLLWQSLGQVEDFPRLNFKTIKNFLSQETRELLLMPKLFTSSLYEFLPKEMKDNKNFVDILDQLLLISTQQTSKTCPAFMGILGFFYPLDTHAIEGGMWGLVKSLEEKIKEFGGEISLRNPCLSITKQNDKYIIKTKKEEFVCDHIISNISPELFNRLYKEREVSQDKGKIWGAMTAYFAFSSQKPVTELYQQVHDSEGSMFFSFSHPDDIYRSKMGQMVTVSTHVDCLKFSDLSNKGEDDSYNNLKNEFEKRVRNAFINNFKEYVIDDIFFDSVGTPLTFKHYTQRPDGEVGGLIHGSVLSLLRLMPNKLKDENIYFVGDYSFPGQGIVSVFQSSLNTIKE